LPLDKQSPKAGARRTLSAKNWRTLDLFYEVQAAGTAGVKLDSLARRNLGLIARTLAEHERLNGFKLSALLQVLANRPAL
jgi:hypothetical protein